MANPTATLTFEIPVPTDPRITKVQYVRINYDDPRWHDHIRVYREGEFSEDYLSFDPTGGGVRSINIRSFIFLRLAEAFGIDIESEGSLELLPEFIAKNVFVRGTGNAIEIVPIDWEKAGWGVLAEDLSTVDLDAYLRSAAPHFPHLTVGLLKRATGLGKVFRSIVFIGWAVPGLSTNTEEAVDRLTLSNSWLDVLLPALENSGAD